MSRNRTYGKSIVIMKDAIEQANVDLIEVAYSRLYRHFVSQASQLRVLGIDVDLDSWIDLPERDEIDSIIIGYKVRGRQRRNWLQRILWAIKL